MTHMRRPKEGAVLVFAVLLLAAGVFVLTAIAQLAATQSVIGQNEWAALTRRVTLENSRAMARQYVLSTMFSNVVPSTPVGYTNPDTPFLGGFSISNPNPPVSGLYWNNASVGVASTDLKISPFSPMERGGFYPGVAKAALLSDSATTNQWTFLVRTRSPLAAGYSYVQQQPADAGLSGTRYIDRINFYGFSNMPAVRVSSVTNTNSSETNGYMGYFNVPVNLSGGAQYNAATNVPENPASITSLRVEIDLAVGGATGGAELLVFTNFPATTNYTDINGVNHQDLPVRSLLLKGTSAGSGEPPLLIVVPSSANNLTNLFLSGRNEGPDARRVYIRFEPSSSAINVVATNNSSSMGEWRLCISAVNRIVNFDLGLPKIVGGIRTDENASGVPNISLQAERDPAGLDAVGDQMMWLEDYRAQ